MTLFKIGFLWYIVMTYLSGGLSKVESGCSKSAQGLSRSLPKNFGMTPNGTSMMVEIGSYSEIDWLRASLALG